MFVIRLLNPEIRLEDVGKLIFVYLDKDGPNSNLVWNCTNPKEATRFDLVEASIFQHQHPDIDIEILNEIVLDDYIEMLNVMES